MNDDTDFIEFYNKYMEMIKATGREICKKCFDDRNIDYDTKTCEDCLKMEELLKDIRPLN